MTQRYEIVTFENERAEFGKTGIHDIVVVAPEHISEGRRETWNVVFRPGFGEL